MKIKELVKLTKGETNQLLRIITEENPKYGLILKIQYLYARNIGEVYNLEQQDINMEKNTITFKTTTDKITYPLHPDIKEELQYVLDTKKGYIFQDGDRPLHSVKDAINYYLHKKTEALKELEYLDGLRLTTKDFRALRGQHLYMDGVDFTLIHELFHNTNTQGTKNIIQYHKLRDLLHPQSLDEVFEETHLNVYHEEEFSENPIYYVTDMEGNEAVLEIQKDNTFSYYGDDDLKEKVVDFNTEELQTVLDTIEVTGDYILFQDVKYLKN